MSAQAKRRGGRARKLAALIGVALYALVRAPAATEPAVADGDTRTVTFVNHHTNEMDSFTFRVNGQYDQAVLDKLNWFMRDWRLNEPTHMDPRLFDIVWEVYRGSGSAQPIDVLSGYRSPQTNAMLRRRSRQVAEHSQHMQGKAIDAHFQDIGPAAIRDVAMRMQEGGVGFYPIGSTPWIHIDSGTVRYWPRMSRASMARLFPDGKTVFIPSDGEPMAGYDEARAMIEARGEEVQTASRGGLLGWMFGGARGGGADDDEESGGAGVLVSGRGGAPAVVLAGRGGGAAGVAAPTPVVAPVAVVPDVPAPPPPPPVVPTPESIALAPVAQAADEVVVDEEPRAPLPPRRPAGLFVTVDAPAPPHRPSDLALAAANTGGSDVIASLIERDALPAAIAKGPPGLRKTPAPDATLPKSALALTEPGPANGDALARAALLVAPLPPPRPHAVQEDGVSAVARTPPPRPPRLTRPSTANPFGDLVVGGFRGPVAAESPTPVH